MGSMTKSKTLFFEDKPLFGLDIGHGKVRVLQLRPAGGILHIVGYGETTFDPKAIENGVIVNPETIAKAVQDLFKHHLIGDITTNRVAVSLPIARAYTRSIEVPGLSKKEVAEAVQTEVEQYIPAAITDLYVDYTQSTSSAGVSNAFIVAMPSRIVDSYVMLTRLLGLESVILQTSSGAGSMLFAKDSQSDIPTLLVDFGSDSADITVYDNGPLLSGTVACGSDLLTDAIAKALDVTEKEAVLIKAKYGLGPSKKQPQIEKALAPALSLLIKELKRTMRYFEEHSADKQKITQVVISGGGANMPGIAEYLTSNLRVAVRSFDPTTHMDFGRKQPFNLTERMSYVTATGLATIDPAEVFAV
jgi:type IV pilus assembly protein PilM